MKRKVLPTPAEAKAETFSEKYDDPTARPTTSFESGNPMRKGCANKTKMIIYFIIKRLKHRIRRAYSPLVPCTKTKRPDFEIRPFPSQRLRLRTTVLNYLDSNQERQNQNLLCYHYTTAQTVARKRDKDTKNFTITNSPPEKRDALTKLAHKVRRASYRINASPDSSKPTRPARRPRAGRCSPY